ncbi:MAG: MMPL family transporter [Bacteroidota bacterium]
MFSNRARITIVVLFALFAAVAGVGLTKLEFAFGFESFLPDDDEDLTYYVTFKDRFDSGNTSVAVGIYREAGVFEREFLAHVHDFTLKARKLPMVASSTSLTNMKDFIEDPNFPILLRVLDWKRSEDLAADSLRIVTDPRFRNTFVSHTGKMLVVLLEVPGNRSYAEEEEFVYALEELIARYPFERTHEMGFAITHYQLTRLQKEQFVLFVVLATVVMLLSMVLLFRRFWGTIIAFLSVFLSMIYFFGGLGIGDKPLDLMATLFPILLVIVGTSDVVHIMTKYVDELNRGRSRKEALGITVREIGLATFMTSLTTAIGFVSLLSSRMPPIRSFGLLAAVGVFVAFLTVILLSLSFISWFRAGQLIRSRGPRSRFHGLLEWSYRFTKERPRQIAVGALVVVGVCLLGASQISLNLTNQRDLPRNSKILNDFLVLDEQLGGINSIHLALETRNGHTFHDLAIQRDLQRMENFLDTVGITGPVISPLVYYKIANRALHGNRPEYYRIAEDAAQHAELQRVFDKKLARSASSIISRDDSAAHLYLNLTDIGSRKTAEINAKIDAWTAAHLDSERLTVTHTGHRYIFDKNQENLVGSLMQSLILAFLVVALFMAAVFRNAKMVLISLIPNVIPLLITAAIIGFLHLEFDPKIAIVFTVAFGIAVDDSIHFLARFKLEYDKGRSVDEAIHTTFMETGKALIITSLILFFGFACLIFSAFPPTFTIGLLLSITLGVALVADFLLLPICLRWMMGAGPMPKTAPASPLPEKTARDN